MAVYKISTSSSVRLCCFPKGIGPNKERGKREEETPPGEHKLSERNGLLHSRSEAGPAPGQREPGRRPAGKAARRPGPAPPPPRGPEPVSCGPRSWFASEGRRCPALVPSDRHGTMPASRPSAGSLPRTPASPPGLGGGSLFSAPAAPSHSSQRPARARPLPGGRPGCGELRQGHGCVLSDSPQQPSDVVQ